MRRIPLLLLLLAAPAWAVDPGELPVDVERFDHAIPGERDAGPWWPVLGDPGLDALLERGLAGNHDMAASWARVRQSKALVFTSLSALLPSIQVNGAANLAPTETLGFQFGVSGLGAQDRPDLYTSGSLALSGSLGVDVFGRNALGYKASRFDEAASEGDRDAQAIALATALAEGWYDAVFADAQLAVVERQVANARDLLASVEGRYGAGVVTGVDLLQQRQQVASTESLLPLARAQAASARQRLAVLVGVPPEGADFDLPAGLPDLPPPPPTGTPDQLLDARPDLAATAARWRAARVRQTTSILALTPTFSLTGETGIQFLRMNDTSSQQYWQLGARMNLPIFMGGRNYAGIQQAAATEDLASETHTQTVLRALQEVESAVVQDTEQRARLDAVRARHGAARAAYEAARDRYLDGTGDYLSVFTSVNVAQAAELDALSAWRQALSARIQLHDALGGTWPSRIGVTR